MEVVSGLAPLPLALVEAALGAEQAAAGTAVVPHQTLTMRLAQQQERDLAAHTHVPTESRPRLEIGARGISKILSYIQKLGKCTIRLMIAEKALFLPDSLEVGDDVDASDHARVEAVDCLAVERLVDADGRGRVGDAALAQRAGQARVGHVRGRGAHWLVRRPGRW